MKAEYGGKFTLKFLRMFVKHPLYYYKAEQNIIANLFNYQIEVQKYKLRKNIL